MAWVDYRKAFDSVPHSWILKVMEVYGLSRQVIQFMRYSMKSWKTTLHMTHQKGIEKTKEIPIRCGIFQGDSFSPLLFCLALFPLSRILDGITGGFKINNSTITHLFYMDDLKLYAKNDKVLFEMITATHQFSEDIGMQFGIEKCAKVTLKKGKQTKSEHIYLPDGKAIQDLEQEKDYKYLGIEEAGGISHNKMKDKIRKEYYRRVRKVVKTELNSKNKMQAINSLAVPVVQYSWNIINWKLSEIRRMDVKTRKLLTIHRMHHPKADVQRLYVPRSEGGRGLLNLENSYKISTIGLNTYLQSSTEWTLRCVDQHHKNIKLYSISKQSIEFSKEINLSEEHPEPSGTPIEAAKIIKHKAKDRLHKSMKATWERKPLHGQFVKRTAEQDVSQHLTNEWLKGAGLKGETEGLLIAAQDQALATKNYLSHISKTISDDLCRMCKSKPETIDHIVAGCSTIAATEYLERHNQVGRYIHWRICQTAGITTPDKWYQHEPEAVIENDNICILWDFPIHTDRTTRANRPDIVIKDKTKKVCQLIDFAIPSDKNVNVKEFEKKYKYKDLEIEIQRMWKMKTKVTPVVIGALGIISKDFENYIKDIPGAIDGREAQKIALLGTAHILRKVLMLT